VPRVAIEELVPAAAPARVVAACAAATLPDPAAQVRAARERRLSTCGALSARLTTTQLQQY
jgi:hypothetical protein